MRIQNASERMSELIDALLNLSRVSRAEFNRQKVNISALCEVIAEELRESEPGRQIEFHITKNMIVEGDTNLIRIAMENLLSNSVKYTGKREQAIIYVGVMEQSGEQVYFVRDNGVGFDMTYADKLFAPFQRMHHPRDFPGSGIGLSIVQRIFFRHGGRIWAEAEVDKGATFYFTIGRAQEEIR